MPFAWLYACQDASGASKATWVAPGPSDASWGIVAAWEGFPYGDGGVMGSQLRVASSHS